MGGPGSGGARARSGPAPEPDALRRDRDASTWQRFPATREAPAPPWPLSPKASARELAVWKREWRRGEANAWDAYDMATEVAFYVRQLVECEVRNASTAARTLLMRQQESLGLTMAGRARNRWIIAAPGRLDRSEPAPPADGEAPGPTPVARRASGPSAKERLAKKGMGVVDGGA